MSSDNTPRLGIVYLLVNIFIGFLNLGLLYYLTYEKYQNIDFDPNSISMTVLTLILTVLTIFLAMSGFFGFYMIRGAAIFAAEEAGKERIDERFNQMLRAKDIVTDNRSRAEELDNFHNSPLIDENSVQIKDKKQISRDDER